MSDAAARGSQPRSAAGGRNPWLIAVVVSIATFMLVLDTSIANVALLNIAGDLAAGVDEATWIITTYLVANAVIIPVSGWLANVIGRKRYYMMCVAGFTISSFLCGIAWNLQSLIVFRVLQGLSGGGMAPSEQSILADTFPPNKRAQAFALYGIAVIIAPTIGPTLGGWITDNYSWPWIFYINLPIGLVSAFLVLAYVHDRVPRLRDRSIDALGIFLLIVSVGCLQYMIEHGQREDWFDSRLITTLTVVGCATGLLLVWRSTSGCSATGPCGWAR